MLNKLPNSHQTVFPKKDALILWTLENDRVDDYKIYEICSPERAQKLYSILESEPRISYFSSGNCYSDWNKWTLEDCIVNIFKYLISDQQVLDQIFRELGKIEEFSLRMSYFNNNYWKIDERS